MKKIKAAIIKAIEELKDPEIHEKLFAVGPQIEFIKKYKDSFKGLRSLPRNQAGSFVNHILYLLNDCGIETVGFYYDNPLSPRVIGKILYSGIPHYLLKISSARSIRFMDNNFMVLNHLNGIVKRTNVEFKDPNSWPADYIPACTEKIYSNAQPKLSSLNFHSEIQLWPLDGYIQKDCCTKLLYMLYCLLHELAHTIFYSFQEVRNDLGLKIKHGENTLVLNNFFDRWSRICQEEVLPASYYGGYYAPDILDWALEKPEAKKAKFISAIGEEFAECFAWYIMGFMENPWGKTGKLHDFDLGTGAPSKKNQMIELLLKGRAI